MANEVQDLGVEVEKTVGVEASASALIAGFAAYVLAHATDPVALRAYANSLKTASDDLAASVAANPLPTDAGGSGAPS